MEIGVTVTVQVELVRERAMCGPRASPLLLPQRGTESSPCSRRLRAQSARRTFSGASEQRERR